MNLLSEFNSVSCRLMMKSRWNLNEPEKLRLSLRIWNCSSALLSLSCFAKVFAAFSIVKESTH